ncbi:MAG: hypothetical protein H6Q84_932 [Deltaproteobacteria bacterium]|nr:hypothetical protein [Deltaproteobacteria bacterium]
MRKLMKSMRYMLYPALFLGGVLVSLMGYDQVMTARSEKTLDRTTWLPKKEIVHLMRLHGTDGLKVTQDEVYILRDSTWIPVRKRARS